jgi:signal transduction histidine kinase
MLSILSHDFNAPVGNLVSTLGLFDDDILTDKQFKDISVKLKAQLEVLTISLADVLHWSKMQAAGDEGNAAHINIETLMQEILPLFQHALDEKNISLVCNIKNNTTVWAYKDHLKLIFRNLLSNAIKYSHIRGTIFIDALADDGLVTINIKDEGTGMKPETLEALQNDQLRFNSSLGTAKEKGTGLGLMLVREFLYKNNGTLKIYSDLGEGSTFCITLPEKDS